MQPSRRFRRSLARGFTLVEMIGVMAIAAIILALVAPSVVRQIQTATATGEDAKLDDIAQALTNAIRATGLIPNPNLDPATTNASGYGWAYLASNYTRLTGANLLSVFPGATTDTRRRLYLSTNLAGAGFSGGFANTISNWGATPFPTNAKMYLVSASRPDFALSLRTNGPGAQTNNNNFASAAVISLESWNKQFSDSICVAPNTLADSSWTNKGEFLHVRTIDLAPIFSEARAAQQKAIEQEDKNLEEITRALLAYIQATGTIPDPTIAATAAGSWVANVSAYSSLGNQAIQFSFPANSIGGRRFYLDLNLLPYVGAPPPAGWAALPAGPASGYLVSCSKSDNSFLEPSTINGGTALSPVALTFLRTWQKTPDPSGVIAANNTEIVAAAWANRGEFLHVKSIDLLSLFCRVELEDLRSPANANITNPGSSYTGPITINNNGVTLTLTADSSGKLNSVSIVSPPGKNLWSASGTPPESSTIPISITAGGGTGGNIALVFPAAPSYAAGLGALSQMPAQTVVFYVLKGGSINLSGTSFVVRQDVKYQFSNGTWRQVY